MTCLNAFPIRNNNNNNLLRINYNNTNDNNNNNNNNNNNTTITTNIIIKRKKKPRYDKYRYWFQSWTNGASVDKTNVSLSESERTPTETACMHHNYVINVLATLIVDIVVNIMAIQLPNSLIHVCHQMNKVLSMAQAKMDQIVKKLIKTFSIIIVKDFK